jgi:FkbM family methyltransferase
MRSTDMGLVASDVEAKLVEKYISSGDVVFDVGAFEGCWSDLVLKLDPKELHLFEPIPQYSIELQSKFSSLMKEGKVFVSNCAIFSTSGTQSFYYYVENPTLSTIYRREKAEEKHNIQPPQLIEDIPTVTLDEYCREWIVEYIDYLKLDVEGAEYDVLKGAERMLAEHRIKYIEFEYGGTYLDSNTTLKGNFEMLRKNGFVVWKASSGSFMRIDEFLPKYEDYEFSIYLAERLD